jgi:imidazoleglycerol phosphate synthase glutamine amidotransferase subunit HisH
VISVFDYGAGNLQSVQNTLGAIGAQYELIRDAEAVERSHKLILPGVGHFGQMLRALDTLGVRDAIVNRIRVGVPFLGICLGLQALFESSEEAPGERGLGIYPGVVKRFKGDVRIPHMGWNQLNKVGESRMMQGVGEHPYVYFANSYYCPLITETSATCDYTRSFTAAVEKYNVCGVQFHPEKSGAVGLQIVRNFIEKVC